MTNTWQETDATIGVSKIFAGFAVSLTDVQVSVTEQWINTSLRLVTHDFDHKFWNYANQFDLFISPKVNPAKRLQKERFNSLTYCCLISIYLDGDILAFLDKYSSITNTLACIIRSFSTLDYVRILACVGVILGVHLIEPFLSLTSSTMTDYDDLMKAFPQLYSDFLTVNPELLLHRSDVSCLLLCQPEQVHRHPLLC